MNKRSFIKKISLLGLTAFPMIGNIEKLMASVAHLEGTEIARDEDFWEQIRGTYKLKPDYINLENGYYCFLPQDTLEHFIKHIRDINYQGSYYMRNYRVDNRNKVAAKLAEMAGCGADELIITRNTTESLDTIIGGVHWKKGDEAVLANQDYGSMVNMFKLVEKRYGIKLKIIDVPLHPKNDEEVVATYEAAITKKTKLLMVCHMVNITGHILPIRKICDMAHAHGVEVMVDGAHAFGHFNFSINDLNCDYYGTSLHKWLSAPLGAGFLYVKKQNIPKIWPMFGSGQKDEYDISRLNHTGTHPCHTDLAIANAMDYHNAIGSDIKEARLRYIQNYWTDKVRDQDHVILNTPKERHRSCGIANVGIKGINPKDLAKILFDKYKIFCVGIDSVGVHGCRITPNVYTSTKELDILVDAIESLG
jgi:selenocysteine lyase/cysteine desulfurase